MSYGLQPIWQSVIYSNTQQLKWKWCLVIHIQVTYFSPKHLCSLSCLLLPTLPSFIHLESAVPLGLVSQTIKCSLLPNSDKYRKSVLFLFVYLSDYFLLTYPMRRWRYVNTMGIQRNPYILCKGLHSPFPSQLALVYELMRSTSAFQAVSLLNRTGNHNGKKR